MRLKKCYIGAACYSFRCFFSKKDNKGPKRAKDMIVVFGSFLFWCTAL